MSPRFTIGWVTVLFIASTAAAQAKRLDYRQEQSLKDATYFLDNIEGIIAAVNEKSAAMKVGDPSVQLSDVNNLLANLDRCTQYLTNADNRFKQLPADHPKVKEQRDRFDALSKSLETQREKIKALQQPLAGAVNQGGTQEYQKDFDRLKEINQMFGNPQILQTRPEQAVEIIKQIPAVKAERARIAEKYAALLHQNTGDSQRMNGTLRYFDQQFANFDRAAQEYAQQAPAEIDANVERALQMARQGVENKNPLFFKPDGGINQWLGEAETRLAVLTALSPDSPDTKAAAAKLAEARGQVKQMSGSLLETIIQTNQPPADQYGGADKAELIAIVRKKWSEGGNGSEPLKVGINSSEWKRDTRWEWNGSGWTKVDKSRAQGHVVVKLDDKLAGVYYVNLVKDHQSNDKIEAYFFNDPKEKPETIHTLLLSNVK